MSPLFLVALCLVTTIRAQCSGYQNCTDCVNDASAGFVACEWDSTEDYCYNWWDEQVDGRITEESYCPENELCSAEAAAVIIIVVHYIPNSLIR